MFVLGNGIETVHTLRSAAVSPELKQRVRE